MQVLLSMQRLSKTNMKKYSIFLLFFFTMHVVIAQFAPPAGQPGTTAMYKDSSAFIGWATGSRIVRGYQDISDPSLGYTTIGDSTAAIGKADGMKIVSLGDGGSAVMTFKLPIINGPGYDFAVFENGFNDTFLELGFVEVSSDGVNYFRFPATSNTQDSIQFGNDGETDARKINNLAGKYSATFGTPFDLQELEGITALNLNRITHVKVIDVIGSISPAYATYDKNGRKINDPWPTAFPSGGFDLDAVGIIHQATVSVAEALLPTLQFHVFPNPVSPSSKIELTLKEAQPVTIEVLDLQGRLIALVADEVLLQSTNSISMEGLNLKNGIYLLCVKTGREIKTEKIIVLND
jgi:hypothetical protein